MVTPFIIEGYKNLQPDPGDLTVAALTYISLQLAASNQSDTLPPFRFAAPNHTVRSNVLFFPTLALSLGCALAAIPVKQWAHNYLHATHRHPSPRLRAKIRSYLDEGVKRFSITIPCRGYSNTSYSLEDLWNSSSRSIKPVLAYLHRAELNFIGVSHVRAHQQ